jgi:hypothetical protein
MIGHICWYKENTVPHLHPQCFIIKTSAIKKLTFDSDTVRSRPFDRSIEDMHDGRSPLELFLTDQPIQEYDFLFGTNIIHQILSNGYRVLNFDNDWRFGSSTWPIKSNTLDRILNNTLCPVLPSRGFCFPNNTTEKFADALKTMTISTDIDTSQQLLIELANEIINLQNSNVVSILHWDTIPNVALADHVVATASGFFAEILALRTGANSISFYDVNPHTIEFKKSLYTEWNGNDYISYATNWATERGLVMEPKWIKGQDLAARQDLQEVFNNWDYLKALKKDFTECDIVKDVDQFLRLINPNSIVHTSTILNYYLITAFIHSKDEIEKVKQLITQTGCTWYEA